MIRAATASDAELLADLNRHVHDIHLAAEPHRYRPTEREALVQWFSDRLAQPDCECLIAEHDGAAVGFVSVRYQRHAAHPFAHAYAHALVDQLAVDPAARHRGHGRALMEAVHERARHAGFACVELDVRAFNHGAEAFYRTLGYEPVNIRMCARIA